MERRTVPGTDIEVSPVCLGTMTYGRPVEKAEAIRLTHLALDLGINFVDTANIYEGYDRVVGSAGGVAEEILGEALKGRRSQVVLITKVGNLVGQGPDDGGLGRRHILREIDRSLRRLRTDYVDFYLAHRPDPETPLEEVVGCFDEIVRSGKARHWGFSNFDASDVRRMVAIAEQNGLASPRLSQPHYSILNREIEKEHLPVCRRYAIGVACYRVLGGGLLTGKYAPGSEPPEGSRAREMPSWLPLDKQESDVFRKVAAVAELAREAGVSPAQYAIAWAIAREGVTAAIVGVKREAQLREAAAAAGLVLSADRLDALDAILARRG